jgi:anti-anti-sigma factor
MKFSKADLCKIHEKIEKGIQAKRKEHQIRHMDDLIKQQKKLPFVKEVILDDNMAFVKLKGAVDSSTIPLIRKRRGRHLTGQRHVILDFKEVKHIDSATLGKLAVLFSELKSQNKKLAILNASPALLDYIDLLNLKSIVQTYNSKKEAIAALA